MFTLCVQVLIASHLPSYELRHNQVESIFLSAIDMYGHQFCIENLQVSGEGKAVPTDLSVIWKRTVFSRACVSLPHLLETDPLGNVHLRRPAELLLPQQSSGTNGCPRGRENTFILIPRWLCWESWGVNLWLVPPGVRPAGLHRVRAEQCSASAAEGQHVHSRVPVHAAHLAPKQVMRMQDSHDALVLHILAVVVPAPPHFTPPHPRWHSGQDWRHFFIYNQSAKTSLFRT